MLKQLKYFERNLLNYGNNLIRFAKLERILAGLCLFIPLILYLVEGTLEDSISDYAYMKHNQVYVFLLSLAAMLFIVNGTIYKRKWYNTILGIALAGVALLPNKDFFLIHYIFAICFFLGSTVFIIIFTSFKKIWVKLTILLGVMIAMAAHFIFDLITLLTAEWIAFGIIAIHYIAESYRRSEGIDKIN